MNKHGDRDTRLSTHWVGMDVAEASFDASLVRSDQHYPQTALREIPVQSFKHSLQGVEDFLSWLDAQGVGDEEVRVIMEATGRSSMKLAVLLLDKRPELAPAIANPRYTCAYIKSMGVRNKTDRLEARALGFYGVERHPVAYEPLSPERAELRELSRYRDSLVRRHTAEKNRGRECIECHYVQKMQKKRKDLLKDDIVRVEKEMKKLVKQHDELKRDIDLLSSIYGVAFIHATTILCELGDLRRFELARQLTAFAGMSPRHHQSGTSIHKRSRLCKQGNPRIRRTLFLAAMTAVRGKNQFRRTYKKLIKQGKPRMVALVAIMRKLLILMRAILISGKPYQPLGITRQSKQKNTEKELDFA